MSFRHGRNASTALAVIGLLVLATLGLPPSDSSASPKPSPWLGVPVGTIERNLASASTAVEASTTVESAMRLRLLDRLNADRVAAGLVPLRGDLVLRSVAEPRAARMATAGVLDHAVAGGDIGAAVSATGLRWLGVAEDIGYSTASWGTTSIDWIYRAWEGSPEHWQIMMDARMNYVGVGLAESTGGTTYASLVFAETTDRTAPVAGMASARLSGRTATFAWTGHDVVLQSHTSGLAGYDVAYRVDGGVWRTIRSNTTATTLVLANRIAGHAYAVRVRARDRAGNVSAWSIAVRVVVH